MARPSRRTERSHCAIKGSPVNAEVRSEPSVEAIKDSYKLGERVNLSAGQTMVIFFVVGTLFFFWLVNK